MAYRPNRAEVDRARGVGAPSLPGIDWNGMCPPTVGQIPYRAPGTVFTPVDATNNADPNGWLYGLLPSDNMPGVYGVRCAVTQFSPTKIQLGQTVKLRTNYPLSGKYRLVKVVVAGRTQPFWLSGTHEAVIRPTSVGKWGQSQSGKEVLLEFYSESNDHTAIFTITDFDAGYLVMVSAPGPSGFVAPSRAPAGKPKGLTLAKTASRFTRRGR